VVGREGEEIDCDKYGRVKVQFHWDRRGHRDENSSCWIRVGTIWAGKQWGAIHIPRIGQEVIVAFLEGDPDQPIIIGSVYNQEQMPPYELPANQTQSGIKSRSSKGGTAENFNEIRFEDKKGEEEVYAHAERNLTTVVEADESRSVGHDRKTTIEHDDELTVRNDRKATITLNDEESVGNKQTVSIGVERSTTIGTKEELTVGATRSTSIGASESLTVGATISITAGGQVTITAPMITLNAGAVMISGVLTVAGSIVSPVYSPGVGNLV
jgi:type VI secretion system secreted protein VgrG